MNESTTVTISIEEYKELLMSRIKLNTLAAYMDSAEASHYIDREYVGFILGVLTKGVK